MAMGSCFQGFPEYILVAGDSRIAVTVLVENRLEIETMEKETEPEPEMEMVMEMAMEMELVVTDEE